jgi:hypothetical protein
MESKYLIFSISVISLLLVAGCASSNDQINTANIVTSTTIPIKISTTTESYVAAATPFYTPTPIPDYPIITQATQLPEDRVCLVYDNKTTYTNTKDAIAFDLVNPPMYLNFTIFETKNGVADKDVYYAIKIRDKNTGEIYNQFDGRKVEYSPVEGYSLKLNLDDYSEIIKILSVRELQIEKEGNGVAIQTQIWVKPSGNIEEPFDMNSNRCINWPVTQWTKL